MGDRLLIYVCIWALRLTGACLDAFPYHLIIPENEMRGVYDGDIMLPNPFLSAI